MTLLGRSGRDKNGFATELAMLRQAVMPPTTPTAPEVDYDRLARRVRELHAEEEGRWAAEEERRLQESLRGGPCVYCGIEISPERDRYDGQIRARWRVAPRGGESCSWCEDDLEPSRHDPDARDYYRLTDLDHRLLVLRRLLGNDALGDWVMPFLMDRAQFKWWHETPAATGGGSERFAYVDVEMYRARLAPESAPPFTTGPPCSRCGCAYMFIVDAGSPEQALPMLDERGNVSLDGGGQPIRLIKSAVPAGTLRCQGCREFDDLTRVAENIIGLGWKAAQAAGGFGLCWYRDLPEGDTRRQSTLAPFAYLDVAAIRRRAFEAYPEQHHWRVMRVWQQLHAESAAANA